MRSATPFISALRSEASSFALPRRAISSPATRWRWRSCSTSRMRARRSVSRAQGSTPARPGKACTSSRDCPRLASMARRASRFSTTYLRSSMAGQDSTEAPRRPGARGSIPPHDVPPEDPQGGVPGRRPRDALPPRHEGAAQGDAAPRGQADHPVRDRGGGGLGPHPHHHRHRQGQERDRGPLRRVLRARAAPRPARADRRPRAGAGDLQHDQRVLRAAGRAARPRPRRPPGARPRGRRALRGDARRRHHRRAPPPA